MVMDKKAFGKVVSRLFVGKNSPREEVGKDITRVNNNVSEAIWKFCGNCISYIRGGSPVCGVTRNARN